MTINVLITGANRGIGKELVKTYLSRPDHFVIAAVRNPTTSSQTLLDLPHASDTKLVIVKIDSMSNSDAETAIKNLKADHDITKLDIVIANAGICSYFGPAAKCPAQSMADHFQVNTIAPLLLFQATVDLLDAAPKPKFVAVSSIGGSTGILHLNPSATTPYGVSKAALNHLVVKIHLEHPNIIAFPLHPGWIETDMGHEVANSVGWEAAPTTMEEGFAEIIGPIDNATREKTSGTFAAAVWQGEQVGW